MGNPSNGSLANFDVIAFESERDEIFFQTEQQFFESRYEIDSCNDCFGSLFRVWDGQRLIGTFYQQDDLWFAEPFYHNRRYQNSAPSSQESFGSSQEASDHIIRYYEG